MDLLGRIQTVSFPLIVLLEEKGVLALESQLRVPMGRQILYLLITSKISVELQ